MDDTRAGWIVGTAFALPYGATALTLAALLRRRRASVWWLVGGVLVWTSGSVAIGAAQTVGELDLARAVLGVGQGIFVPVAIARLGDIAGENGRARALSLFTSGSAIGRSTALLATGALLSILTYFAGNGGVSSWRWLFALTALPNLLILPFLARNPGQTVILPVADDTADAFEWRTLILFFAVGITPVLLFQAVAAWLPTLFVRDRGLTAAAAATLLGAVTLGAAPAGQLLGGWMMTRQVRWHDRLPLIVLAGMMVTLVPLMGVAWAPTLAGAILSVVVLNLTLGLASFCALFGVQLLIPPDARVSVNGIYFSFLTLIGFGLGPVLTGGLATAAGGDAMALRNALLMTGVITTALCGLAVATTQSRFRKRCRS